MHSRLRAFVAGVLVFTFTVRARAASDTPRRKFMTGVAAMGAVGAGMGSSWGGGKLLDAFGKADTPSYAQTVFEQHLVMIGEVITTNLLTSYFGEGTFGNAGITEERIKSMLENPVKLWTEMAVVAPTVEEVLFRYLPAAMFGTGWFTGTVSAGLFAAMHGLDKIPIGQFAGGIWFWYLMKHRGISHAMLAHAANNHVAAVALIVADELGLRTPVPEPACAKSLGGFVERWARAKARATRGM